MDPSFVLGINEHPYPRLFPQMQLNTSMYLASTHATGPVDSPVNSSNDLAMVRNWCEQAAVAATQSARTEQDISPISLHTHQTSPFITSTPSVSPPTHMASNFDPTAITQTTTSPIAFQMSQFALSGSPLTDASSACFPMDSCAPLLSTSPLLSTMITVSSVQGHSLGGVQVLSHSGQQSPSDLMYNLSLNDPYADHDRPHDNSPYSVLYTNGHQISLFGQVHYEPRPNIPAQLDTQTSPLLPGYYDEELQSPTSSSSPAPLDMHLPSPPKSLSGDDSDYLSDSDDEAEEECPQPRRRNRVRKSTSAKNPGNQLSPVKLMCSHSGCSVTCASLPSLARHEATHEWKGQYPPLRCEACLSTLSNEYSVQRHINRSKQGSLCRLMRVYSFMGSVTAPKKTVRFYPKRAHGKKTVVVNLEHIRAKFERRLARRGGAGGSLCSLPDV